MLHTSWRGLVRALILTLVSGAVVSGAVAFAGEPSGDADHGEQVEAVCAHMLELMAAEMPGQELPIDEMQAKCRADGATAIAACEGDREALIACMLAAEGLSDLPACQQLCEGGAEAEPRPSASGSPEEIAACENMIVLLTREFPDMAGELEVDDCIASLAAERDTCRDHKGAMACVAAAQSANDVEACEAFCAPPGGHGHEGHGH